MDKHEKYNTVADMIDGIADDPDLRDDFEAYSDERQLVKMLVSSRCARGLSQKDVADKMGASQSYLSKLENGVDDELRVGEIDRYLDALDLQSCVVVTHKNATALDELKYHVYSIKSRLEELTDISAPNDGTAERVAITHFETLLNVARVVVDSVGKVQISAANERPFCRLEFGFYSKDDDASGIGLIENGGPASP